MRFLKSLPVLLMLVTSSALAQTPSANQVIGEVTDINNELRQISLGPDKGEPLLVAVTDATVFRRVPAGAVDLTTAVRIAFSDVGKGDRIMAIGQRSEDQKRLDARSVIVMTRSDLTQKQQQDLEAWRKRGIHGIVSAVDPAAGAFTVTSGTKAVIVHTTARASEVRRYAPDSVKYN